MTLGRPVANDPKRKRAQLRCSIVSWAYRVIDGERKRSEYRTGEDVLL